MKTDKRIVYGLLVLQLALAVPAMTFAGLTPFSEDFVYQGRLEQSGVPAEGMYDFQFELFRGPSSSNSVGGPVPVAGVQVSEGVFTAEVPLGFAIDGSDLWLQVAVKQPDDQLYTILFPRHQLQAVPNAVYAAELDHLITDDEVLSGQIQLRVSDNCPAGQAIRAIDSGGGVTCQSAAGAGWSITGNAGTSPGTHFLGTTDDTALELRANNERMVRYEWADGSPGVSAPSIAAGSGANTITDSVAATIAGGGLGPAPNVIANADGATIAGGFGNSVTGARGTIGGGSSNSVGGQRAVVPGGSSNVADGDNSFAAGSGAQALHDNTFVWNHGGGVFASTGSGEFLVNAVRTGFGENNPSDFLHINTPPATNALRVQIDGSTKLRVRSNGGVAVGVNTTPPPDGLVVQGDAVFRGSIEYDDPVNRSWSISGESILPRGDFQWRSADNIIDCTVGQDDFGQPIKFASPVHLPQGATITGLAVRVEDNTVSGDISTRLVRRSLDAGVNRSTLASVQSTGIPGATTLSDTSISNAVVDNSAYAYAFEIDWDMTGSAGDQVFCWARVDYAITGPAP